MLTVIAKRLLIAIPSLIGVVIVTFLLTRALPGDPAAYFAGPAATKEAIQEVRVKLGLDKSLPQQFVRYVGDLAQGDLGQSLTTGQPVVDRNPQPPARLGRADAARPDRVGRDRDPARHLRGGEAEFVGRSHLPRGDDRGRLAAGVLHRADPRLRLLLSARLGARAARAARYIPFCPAQGHRLLSDRLADRRRLRGLPRLAEPACSCRRSPSASSRSRRSRA